MTACAGSTATAACRIGRPPRSPTISPSTAAIRSRSRSGAPMSSGRCGRPRRCAPGGRRRGLAARDPYAIRALVLMLVIATFFAAGNERLPAHHRGLRLAGRDRAGQFPHRCLGEPADLYRQAAGDPAGPAAGRAGADRPAAVTVPAGSTLVIRATGPGPSRRGHHRRAHRAQGRHADHHRRRHRGAPLHHQRGRHRHLAQRGRRAT